MIKSNERKFVESFFKTHDRKEDMTNPKESRQKNVELETEEVNITRKYSNGQYH